jgi:hypothetical protein
MARSAISLRGVGSRGVVDDRDPALLDRTELAAAEDMILTEDVPRERGGYTTAGALAPLGSPDNLISVRAVQFTAGGTVDLVVTDAIGRIGLATSGNSGASVFIAGTWLPRCFYNGELLLCPQNGKGSILRFAGYRAPTLVAAAGTVSTTAGQTTVTGVGTTFTTQAPVGSYLSLPAAGLIARVVIVESNTRLSVAHPIPFTLAGVAWGANVVGVVGLHTRVHDAGTATFTNASAAVAGQGSRWVNGAFGQGVVGAGDSISKATGQTTAVAISAVGSDVGITLTANWSEATATATNYLVSRPLVGRDACAHAGRLWVTGVDWAPRRVYISPREYGLGVQWNEVDAFATNLGAAREMDYVDVPSAYTPGRIEAILPSPHGVLAIATEGVYLLTGELPNVSVRLLDEGTGCIDVRSAFTLDGIAYWAGREGIYRFRGGQVENLLLDKRQKRWMHLIDDPNFAGFVAMGAVREHLIVGFNPNAPSETWAYDIRREAWLGTWNLTNGPPVYIHSAAPAGASREAYMVDNTSTRNVYALSTAVVLRGNATVTTNPGTLNFRTGTNLLGSQTEMRRPVDMKVVYALSAGTMRVSTIVDGSTKTDVDLPTAANPTTTRIRVKTATGTTSGLGTKGRAFALQFARVTGSGVVNCRVMDAQVIVRERRAAA